MRVVHESRTTDEAARLLAVAGATRRVRPPGIVRVVDIDERDDGTVVVITDEPEPSADAPATFGAAASALAALHGQGVAHGAIAGAARLHDAAGRAVLPLPVWRDGDTAGTLDDDVAKLCELAGERPAGDARELATRLAAPSPRVLETNRARAARPERTRLRGTTVGALAAVAGVVTMGVAVLAPTSTARPTLSPTVTATPAPSTTTVTASAVPVTVPASTERVVALAGHRFEVGVEGDLVVLGIWTCEPGGPLVPAIVRPATGDVLVFDSVAPGATARAVTRLDGVTGAGRAIDDAGCDVLLVDTAGAGPVAVDLATGRGGGSPPRSPATVPAP
jgi:hypothetical protein